MQNFHSKTVDFELRTYEKKKKKRNIAGQTSASAQTMENVKKLYLQMLHLGFTLHPSYLQ